LAKYPHMRGFSRIPEGCSRDGGGPAENDARATADDDGAAVDDHGDERCRRAGEGTIDGGDDQRGGEAV